MKKTARTYDGRVRKPVKELVEGIQFDSQFEAQVYRHLRMLFPKEQITCHEAVPILPETPYFKGRDWKCDFKVTLPNRWQPIYVEAKGVNTAEFKLLLQTLGYTNASVIQNLLVVHSEIGIKLGKTIQTVNIHHMYQYLLRFKQ
ncbi:MAG: hypothetical protein KME45_23215 [Stenomitos rutilans HA7619-LM2]|jgi:hypothetical protein|nr:hypothetical protein [Stenomitos rutilans HA7619-LM2]